MQKQKLHGKQKRDYNYKDRITRKRPDHKDTDFSEILHNYSSPFLHFFYSYFEIANTIFIINNENVHMFCMKIKRRFLFISTTLLFRHTFIKTHTSVLIL